MKADNLCAAVWVRVPIPPGEKLEDLDSGLGLGGDTVLDVDVLEAVRPPVLSSKEERPEFLPEHTGKEQIIQKKVSFSIGN